MHDQVAIIDDSDYELVKNYSWNAVFKSTSNSWYAFIRVKSSELKKTITLYMHQLFLQPKNGFLIDHINHDTLDNRRCNLRYATKSQNAMNMKMRCDNISGAVGVSWRKDRNKWRAFITVNMKQISLGHFENIEDAIQARAKAEDEYFGEFKYNRNLKED